MKNVSFPAKFRLSQTKTEEVPAKAIKFDMSSTAAINIAHLGVYYRTQEALRDVSCIIKPGKLMGIFLPKRCWQKYAHESNVRLGSCQ